MTYYTITPSQIVVESSIPTVLGTVGPRKPLATEGTSSPLILEINTTPNPDPQFDLGGYSDG